MQSYKEIVKLSDNYLKHRILCPNYGHSVIFNKTDKIVCNWCKHYVFKDKKIEFEYRLKESIMKNK